MSEHEVHLRERYLALGRTEMPWAARRAIMAFVAAPYRLPYREYPKATPVSRVSARWKKLPGAGDGQRETIVNGVDPAMFTAVESEPAVPTVSSVGGIDPLKDLGTFARAFALVRQDIPEARLRLAGPVQPSNVPYKSEMVALAERARRLRTAQLGGPVRSAGVSREIQQRVRPSSCGSTDRGPRRSAAHRRKSGVRA
ncbi:hypothetical protein [Kocuria sp. SM24M-10]|uniref:hypothetical protein n=1 Tax=Kocuria sp. SM24M-10 TaxID=1660349 RepID=UPI00128B3C65|nr:hypothetical protein [Kocuria sp. SM24M-10]